MKESIIMTHKPSDVKYASMFFKGYLTEEELDERQYSGRPWDIVYTSSFTSLYIIVDDETAIWVAYTNGHVDSKVVEGSEVLNIIPLSLMSFVKTDGITYYTSKTYSSPYNTMPYNTTYIDASTNGVSFCNVCCSYTN